LLHYTEIFEQLALISFWLWNYSVQ